MVGRFEGNLFQRRGRRCQGDLEDRPSGQFQPRDQRTRVVRLRHPDPRGRPHHHHPDLPAASGRDRLDLAGQRHLEHPLARKRRDLRQTGPPDGGGALDSDDRRQEDAHLGGLSAQVRCLEAISRHPALPGRPAGRPHAGLVVSLELPADGFARLHRGAAQPPRHDGFWPGMVRTDFGRLHRPEYA